MPAVHGKKLRAESGPASIASPTHEDATGLSRGVSRWPLHHFRQFSNLDATALGRGGFTFSAR